MSSADNAVTLRSPCCQGRLTLRPGDADVLCDKCLTAYGVREFPALRAVRVVTRPRALESNDEATCYFHAQNQAEAVCTQCGRFLCSVCAVNYGGRVICPTCIATGKTAQTRKQNQNWKPDTIALLIATLPLIIWPTTIMTAPTVLVVVILNWGKTMSPVPRIRWQRWLATAIALIEIAMWTWFLAKLITR